MFDDIRHLKQFAYLFFRSFQLSPINSATCQRRPIFFRIRHQHYKTKSWKLYRPTSIHRICKFIVSTTTFKFVSKFALENHKSTNSRSAFLSFAWLRQATLQFRQWQITILLSISWTVFNNGFDAFKSPCPSTSFQSMGFWCPWHVMHTSADATLRD